MAPTAYLMAFKMPGDRVQPVGFAEEEAFLSAGHLPRLSLPARMAHLRTNSCSSISTAWDLLKALPTDILKVRGLELRFDIHRGGIRVKLTLDNVKLHCTFIVNLFRHDALPIRLDGKQDEYLLLPAKFDQESCGVIFRGKCHGLETGGLRLSSGICCV